MKELLSNNNFLWDVLGPVVMRCVVVWIRVAEFCGCIFPCFLFCVVVRARETAGESIAWRVVRRRAVACHPNGLKLSVLMTQETNQEDSLQTHTHAYKHTQTHKSLSAYPRIRQSNIKRINWFVFIDFIGIFFPLRTEQFCLQYIPSDINNDLCATAWPSLLSVYGLRSLTLSQDELGH